MNQSRLARTVINQADPWEASQIYRVLQSNQGSLIINPCGSDSVCHVTDLFFAGAKQSPGSDRVDKGGGTNQDAIGAAPMVPTI
jgi:hypothetical protein